MCAPILFLTLAPLAATVALLLSPPLSQAAVILSAIISVCGLVLLFKHLLLPLRRLITAISQPENAEIPPTASPCDIIQALEDSLTAREAARSHNLNEARDTIEILQQEIQELREKRAVAVQAQQMTLEALRKTQSGLDALAASVDTAEDAARKHERCKQTILDFSTALHRSECIVMHSGEFLESGGSSNKDVGQELPEVFPWKAQYNTNIPVVDGQHKLLLSYINKLHWGMQKGYDKELLLEILDDLTGYAFTHFATEEIFFTRTAYPLTNKHIEEHQNFRETVTQLRDSVLDGKAYIDIALLEYLKNWLLEHIQRMDAGFAPYVTGVEAATQQ